MIDRLELNGARAADAALLLAEMTGTNVVVTPAAADQEVSLLLRAVDLRTALETLCKVSGLWFREDARVVRIMTAEEYRADLTVQREPQLKVFTLLHPNPEAVAVAIRDLYGPRVRLSLGVDDRFQGARGRPRGSAPRPSSPRTSSRT
jgi:general secretion pathway protein D